ncbi:hypothetical protein GKR67_14485 [Providencia alcalifaciens]|uniref:Bacteriophage protein n=1 Tax=Providencia alcalifaciens TaxID=126385 RepID=A0AAW9VDJ6_9GAMM|nr:hypothetical protein [Providencia rettgeri]MTC35816.1 hypothetical protein [Providencia alcalifaciens]UPS64401.1 hypothetical protein M0M83_07725 [Providencia rettgeri]
MQYRKEDDGDYTFGSNQFLINTPETVAQAVKSRLKLWLEEWFLDDRIGTPHAQKGLGKHVAQGYALSIKEIIQGTQGVVKILDFGVDLNTSTRKVTITAMIETLYGTTSIKSEG